MKLTHFIIHKMKRAFARLRNDFGCTLMLQKFYYRYSGELCNSFLVLGYKMLVVLLEWYRIFLLVCFSFITQVSAFSLTEIRCNVRQEEPHLSRDGLVLSDAVQDEDFPYAVQEKSCSKQKECVGITGFGNRRIYVFTNTTNSSKFGFRFIWKVSFTNVSMFCNFQLHSSTIGNLCLPQTKQVNITALYYDCIAGPFDFGKGTGIWAITLEPRNHTIRHLDEKITGEVNCGYKIVQKSEFCHHVEVKITKPINCLNRSFEIHYNISNLNQSTKFEIRMISNNRKIFDNATDRNMNPTGTIQYVLPNKDFYNATNKITVLPCHKCLDHNFEYTKTIDITEMFQACLRSEPVRIEPYVYAWIGVSLFCLIVILVIIVFCLQRAGIARCTSLNSAEPTSPFIYIVFVDDHPNHRDAVLKFAAFLNFTLGCQVLFELYNNTEVITDPVAWMKQSIARAQKILFIWSPGATKRWENKSADPGQNDMFTPVLVQVLSEISAGKNKNKHSIVCFDYVSCDDIPKELKKNFPNVYKLMGDLGKFCSQLLGHKVINLKKVYTHEYAAILSESVKEMKKHVDKHPTWYKSSKTGETRQNVINNGETVV